MLGGHEQTSLFPWVWVSSVQISSLMVTVARSGFGNPPWVLVRGPAAVR